MFSEFLRVVDNKSLTKIGLISIHSEFVQRMYAGTKRFEFRKVAPKGGVEYFLIYETAPEKRVTGYFKTTGTLVKHPKELWEECSKYAGIDKDRFFAYYEGREQGCAIVLGEVVRFNRKYSLSEIQEGLTAPQSFRYIQMGECDGF